MKEILEMKRRHERHVKKRIEKLYGTQGTAPAAAPQTKIA